MAALPLKRNLDVQDNKTKAKLKRGASVYGCFVRSTDPALVEMLARFGWDFMVFESEHGRLDPRTCEEMVRAAELNGITPIVRVTTNSPSIILRFLDTGAQGIIVPQVNSAEEAERAVAAVKFPPRGNRGLSGSRAADYGQGLSFADHVLRSNRETLVVLYVETAEAVRELPRILAVEGVDVVNVGRTDLSQSLGVPGQPEHPRMRQCLQEILAGLRNSPVALGIMAANPEAARQWRARGARYISINLESLLKQSVQEFLSGARA